MFELGSTQASGLSFTGLLTPLGPEGPLTSFSISIIDCFVQKIRSSVDFCPPGYCWLNLANAVKTGHSLIWCVCPVLCVYRFGFLGEDKLHQGVDCSRERRQSSLSCLFSDVWRSTSSGCFQHSLHQLWRLQQPSVMSVYAWLLRAPSPVVCLYSTVFLCWEDGGGAIWCIFLEQRHGKHFVHMFTGLQNNESVA